MIGADTQRYEERTGSVSGDRRRQEALKEGGKAAPRASGTTSALLGVATRTDDAKIPFDREAFYIQKVGVHPDRGLGASKSRRNRKYPYGVWTPCLELTRQNEGKGVGVRRGPCSSSGHANYSKKKTGEERRLSVENRETRGR